MNRIASAWHRALTAAMILLASGMAVAACDESRLVRPNGGDHLLYTIERSSQNIANLQGRKFRLVVNESAVKSLTIRPVDAFRVSEVARFNGSVAFSAEVINALALYTQESWGNLPKVLTFQVECDPSAATRTASRNQMETVPEIVPISKPVTVPSIPDSVLPPITESTTSPEIAAYEVSSIATASLPPLPEPEPEPAREPVAAPVVTETPKPETAATRAPVAAVPATTASLGAPVPGNRISPYQMRRVLVDLVPVEEKPVAGGKALMRYTLTVRNALTQSIQCDISVESSYLGSYGSDQRTMVDQQLHTAIQLPARGYRSDLGGEITYFPRVLGGDKWMTQDHGNPERSGLQVKNCVPLQNAG